MNDGATNREEENDLAALRAPAEDDTGLSLDELSAAYAGLLAKGDDPYTEAPDPNAEPADEIWAGEDEPTEADAGAEAAEAESAAASAPDDSCEITPRSILEAMLFVGHPENQPLTSEAVAALMRGVTAREVDQLVLELNASYDAEACPYTIVSAGAGYRLVLRDEFAGLRDGFFGRVKAAKLSQAAIDVLAVVAYKQPLTKEAIDELRGKPSSGILSQLVRRGLLRIDRQPEKPRQPLFSTTDRFLELFALESLRDLPHSSDG